MFGVALLECVFFEANIDLSRIGPSFRHMGLMYVARRWTVSIVGHMFFFLKLHAIGGLSWLFLVTFLLCSFTICVTDNTLHAAVANLYTCGNGVSCP